RARGGGGGGPAPPGGRAGERGAGGRGRSAELDDARHRSAEGQRLVGGDGQVVRLLGLKLLGRRERAEGAGKTGQTFLYGSDGLRRGLGGGLVLLLGGVDLGQQGGPDLGVGDLAGRVPGRVEGLAGALVGGG